MSGIRRGIHSAGTCIRAALAVILLLCGAGVGLADDTAAEPPHILVLHSYDPTYGWTAELNRVFGERIAERYPNAVLHVEYMDTKRHEPSEVFGPFADLLQAKYQSNPPDLIAVTDNTAFGFLLERREALFGDVPVVFSGLNDYRPAMHADASGVTGVAERADFRGTIELALSLHPDARHLVSVSDSTLTGRINQRAFDRAVQTLGVDIDVIRLADLTRDDLYARLRELPADSVILSMSLFRTADGALFSAEEGSRFIVDATDQPVYTAWDVVLGTGVVGGLVVSARGQAETQAELAGRILDGASADSIPVATSSPNRYVFDYRALEEHGIRMRQLPSDSIVINEPESPWYLYRAYILTALVIIVVLTSAAILLSTNVIRRRNAEKRLRRSEQKYRNMFESIHDVYAEVRESDGTILSISPSVAKFGYAPADLVGQTMQALHMSSPRRRDLVTRIERDGGVDDYEVELARADGTPFTASISARLEDDAESGRKIVGTIRDITERRQILDELRRLNKAVEEAGHAIYITDRDGVIRYVNPAFEKTTGYPRAEALGRTPNILRSGDMSEDYYRRLWETIGTGETWREYITNRRKDGRIYYASQTIAPILNHAGDIDWFVAIQTDETERIESERQYRLLAENATDMISRHSADGRYTYVSPACRYLLGYEPEELVGRSAYELFHPDDLTQISDSHKRIQQGPEITYVTYRIRRKDGSYVWFETTSKTVWDERTQSVAEIVTVSRDVSGRVRIEERLKEAKAQAESASQAKSEFLANISHEIRTPLHAITGFGELMRQRTDDRTQLRYIRTIEDSAHTLLALLNDILDLSKVEAGRLDISPGFEDPRDLSATVIAMFEPQAQEKHVALERRVEEAVPPLLYFDRARLRQVLVNIVGNAIKFTDDGSVLVRVGGDRRRNDEFDLTVEVRDTGIGMSEETQRFIFEAFSQGTGDSKRSHGGTGLGLAITKRLVERMGGTISVESQEGRGSRFTVALPGLALRDEAPLAAAGTDSRPDRTPGGETRWEIERLDSQIGRRVKGAVEDRIVPIWRRAHDVKMVDDLAAVGEGFAAVGEEFALPALAERGRELAEAARELDIETMEDILAVLEELLDVLQVDVNGESR